MKIEEYSKLQEKENRDQLAIDFDGVIHRNSRGFYDGTVYDSPIEGSIEAVKELSKYFDLIIFSAKAKPDRPPVKGKTGEELIWEWLEKHNISSYIKEVTSEKPRAVAYIDDKGIKFKTWDQTLTLLRQLYGKT